MIQDIINLSWDSQQKLAYFGRGKPKIRYLLPADVDKKDTQSVAMRPRFVDLKKRGEKK